MPIIVVVITGSAPNFSRFSIDERDDGVVGYAATLDAMIVNDIAESLFTHIWPSSASIPVHEALPLPAKPRKWEEEGGSGKLRVPLS